MSSAVWEHVDAQWFYLGHPVAKGFELVLLQQRHTLLAPIFSGPGEAAGFIESAPAGVRLMRIDAGDHRAKEELLRSAIAMSAQLVSMDPSPADLTAQALPVDKVLWYVLSQRRETACL